MKNQFVTYEIALKLKELGFDEECFGYWRNENSVCPLTIGKITTKFDFDDDINYHNFKCLAPLWQQVVDWIYSNYNILIYQYVNPDNIMFWVVKSKVQDFYSKKEYAFLKAIESCQKEK